MLKSVEDVRFIMDGGWLRDEVFFMLFGVRRLGLVGGEEGELVFLLEGVVRLEKLILKGCWGVGCRRGGLLLDILVEL